MLIAPSVLVSARFVVVSRPQEREADCFATSYVLGCFGRPLMPIESRASHGPASQRAHMGTSGVAVAKISSNPKAADPFRIMRKNPPI